MPKPAEPEQEASAAGAPRVFHELLRWMERTAVPASRPDASAADEAAGLVILDLSLRLEHVSRVTDSLRVIDKSHVRRLVTLDVDLRGLTGEQREALTVRRGLTPPDAPSEADGATNLWVPVSRHSRMDLSPVVVRDASDQVLPRLTQGAASRTLVAGLSRLLKLIRASKAERLSPRAMWLILRALESLIEEGPLGLGPRSTPTSAGTSGTEPATDYHTEAEDFLSALHPDLQQSLDRLIEVAYTEYVLVVMLPARTSQGHLQFEAPLIPAALQSTPWPGRVTPGREYTIDYRTEIARSLGSYHVTVEVAEEIYVRRYILCSDADKAAVAELGREMTILSAALAEYESSQPAVAASRRRDTVTHPGAGATAGESGGPEAAEHEALWLELESVVSKLVQLGRRRNLEYRRYRAYIESQELGTAFMEPAGVEVSADEDSLLADLAEGEISLATLDRLADVFSIRPFRDRLEDAGLRPSNFVEGLPRIAQWLSDARLGEDVVVENDPRENGAHAQWRHRPLGFGTPSLEPIRARVFLTLADEKPALADSVRHMLWGLTGVVAGLGLLLQFSGTGPGTIQADALVAVLLLVPGILLSRLDIPNTNSVLGQLRVVPRNVAYLSVILTSGLAVAVATGWTPPRRLVPYVQDHLEPYVWVSAALLMCLLFSLGEKLQRRRRRNRAIPDSADVPWWLRHPCSGPREATQEEKRSADVVFDAISRPPSRGVRPDRFATPAQEGGRHSGEIAVLEHQAFPLWSSPAVGDTSGQADERTSTGRRSLRGAELARTAARAVTAGRSGVELLVEHMPAEQHDAHPRLTQGAGYVRSTRAEPFDERSADRLLASGVGTTSAPARPPSEAEPTETLMSRAGRFTVRVQARPLTGAAADGPRMTSAAPSAGGGRYVVAAPLGPGAFAEPLSTFDFLIELPDEMTGAELLERLLTDESGTPRSTEVTIREVQFPGAPRMAGTEVALAECRDEEAHVLRLSVALPDSAVVAGSEAASRERSDLPTTDDPGRRAATERARGRQVGRLALTRYLARLCAGENARLYIPDTSTSTGPHWRPTVQGSGPTNRSTGVSGCRAGSAATENGKGRHGEVALVTLVGSANGYDAKAAVSMCSLVKKTGVSVLAVSVTRLQDQPLISLVISRCRETSPSPSASTPDAGSRAAVASLAGFLDISQSDDDLLCAVEGRALMVTRLDVAEGPLGAGRTPVPPEETLWLQWSWPGGHPDPAALDPAQLVLDALGNAVAGAHLVHHRSRRDRDGRVKGHARLLVRGPSGDELGKLAYAVERTVQQTLARTHRSPHEVRLRVVRDEGWLPRR